MYTLQGCLACNIAGIFGNHDSQALAGIDMIVIECDLPCAHSVHLEDEAPRWATSNTAVLFQEVPIG